MQAAVDSGDELTLDRMYAKYIASWANSTDYYLDLEMAHPDRVIASRIETFDRDLDRLLNFLGVEQKARPSAIPHRVVNASQRGSGRGSLDTYAGEIAERRGNSPILSRKPQGAPVIRDRPKPRPATRDGLPRSRF
ncbi:MAG: hypothetical protein M3453_01280 [Pseudomonadota bacterium]|nr:hypothetical protein [Pseudomonadota bacterium]